MFSEHNISRGFARLLQKNAKSWDPLWWMDGFLYNSASEECAGIDNSAAVCVSECWRVQYVLNICNYPTVLEEGNGMIC